MTVLFKNNAHSTLASSITDSATSITLASGHGDARFPVTASPNYFYATLIDSSNNLEVVKCTARSSDVLTVVRAQEGTSARAYSTGDRIELRITAQGLELDAGQVQTINGEKHFGNRYIGISANGKFGVKRDPEKLPEGASNPHNGLDVGTTGKEGFFTAFKIQDGVVTDNRSDKVLGVTIEITAPDGTAYRFNHLKNYNPKLKIGAAYNGEIIGEIGNTGASTDIHLDIQKRVNGELVDPLPDMDKLSIGKRLEQTIGKYPFTRSMILKLTKDRDEDNPLSGLNYAKALNRYRQDEVLQKELWEYFNAKSFSAALTKANGDLHLAARYHVANVLRGDMDKFNLPTINAFANQYIQKLRTQGVLP